jgi:glycosyltransferase involved in cell wall biosynthesis
VSKQTLYPAEVILVNDGSPDFTSTTIKQLCNYHGSWIRVVELPTNRGAASARNAGWEAASQPYLAFLDADDTWHPEKLRIQYEYMEANPDVIVSGHRCSQADQEARPSAEVDSQLNITEISPIGLLFRNAFSTPTVMLREDLKFRFPEGKRYAEDVYLWQSVAFAGFRIVRLEIVLACIHKAAYGAGGLSGNMWRMEVGELDNFKLLWRSGAIRTWHFLLANAFSLIKFGRRLGILCARRAFRTIAK